MVVVPSCCHIPKLELGGEGWRLGTGLGASVSGRVFFLADSFHPSPDPTHHSRHFAISFAGWTGRGCFPNKPRQNRPKASAP